MSDEVEQIRARHEATGPKLHWTGADALEINADRATLLRQHDNDQYTIQTLNSQIEELTEQLDAARVELVAERAKAQEFRYLVDILSGEEPTSQDEMGGCVWCGGSPPDKGHYAYATAEPDSHDPECPWLLARAALKEN